MLTYKIEKPFPVLTRPVVSNAFMDRVNAHHPRLPYADKSHWDKQTFSIWIERIKGQFAVGDYVCMAQIHEDALLSPWYYRIEYINELHYNCDWDHWEKEPKALLCTDKNGTQAPRSPKSVRLLTVLEKHRAGISDL